MRRSAQAILIVAFSLAGGLPGPRPADAQPSTAPVRIWIEGESPSTSTFNRHSWYEGDGVRRDWLSPGVPGSSDGDWLAHYTDDGTPATASYDFAVPRSGAYTLWVRASVYRVAMSYSVDGDAASPVDTETDPREVLNLTVPAIDIRFLGWVRVESRQLAAGAHTVTFSLGVHPAWGNPKVHGGIDAIAIVDDDWQPVGARRADAPTPDPPAPGDWYPFLPRDDAFSPESIIDLSHLVEAPAGQHGPLRPDDNRLAFADGTPVKLWGVGASIPASPELMLQTARFYRKYGVNAVRLHPVEAEVGLLHANPDTGERSLDPAALDRLDRWFAALKAQGIYSVWSPFYPHVITPADGYPPDLYAELPDLGQGKSSSGFVNFMPGLQDAEWAWLRALMGHVNPYTGLDYAHDPALAVVEVHNEDSVFWHFPLNDLAAGTDFPRHTAALQSAWAAWLRRRYPDDAALMTAWGPQGAGSRVGDSLANEHMAIYGAWEMEEDGPYFEKAEKARMGDFIHFLADTQRAYFAERGAQLRAVGYKGVTVSTAWQAGGPAAAAANLWTDSVLDAVDRHGYFGGGAGGYAIRTGDVDNRSHLDQPGGGILGQGFEQVEGRPFLMSEWDQMPPNEWKAEIAPLMAFYGMGLNGWDGLLHFHASLPRMGSGWPELNSFVSETPHYFGQFPALALALYRGDITEPLPAASRRVSEADLFRGIDPMTQPLPSGGYPGGDTLDTPPQVLAMGPVTWAVTDLADVSSTRIDWADLWDRDVGRIASSTGELVWDTAARTVEVRASRTQGVVGFAGGRTVDLPAVTVEASTPFVSLLVSALDGRPLDRSGHILITALARDRQLGARYSADGSRLEELGGPPLMLEPVQATLTFRGPAITAVHPVDFQGVPEAEELPVAENRFHIDGRYATYYYEVVRRTAGGRLFVPFTAKP